MHWRLHRFRLLIIPLLTWGLACGLAFAFLHLGSEVGEGETQAFDRYFLQAAHDFRALHPAWTEVLRDLSGLGSTIALLLLTLGACGYLMLASSRRMAAVILVSIASAWTSVQLLKAGFARARPDIQLAEFSVSGLSFPSGHASMSAAVYLTLGLLLAGTRPRGPEAGYIMTVAGLMTLLVGISRVALGVHWATDVIGGWAFGTAWAIGTLLIARRIDRL